MNISKGCGGWLVGDIDEMNYDMLIFEQRRIENASHKSFEMSCGKVSCMGRGTSPFNRSTAKTSNVIEDNSLKLDSCKSIV